MRIDHDALKLARIAAAYRQMTMADYVSALVREHARHDVEAGHNQLSAQPAKAPKGGKPRS